MPPPPAQAWCEQWSHGLEVPTYHSPPQGVRVAAELDLARLVDGILLGQVHKVRGEDEAQEADVEGGDELLGTDGEGAPSASTRSAPDRHHVRGRGGLPAASSNRYLKVPRKSQRV